MSGTPTVTVTTIRLRAANAHLVRGRRGTVLVDSGTAGSVPALRRHLRRLWVEPASLDAVVLTHGHADHAGGARLLVGDTVPVVVGAADDAVLRAGHNPPLHPTTMSARVIRPFVDRAFPPYRGDRLVDGELDLAEFGVDLVARTVGGHTPGSLVVVGRRPGEPALVGDLVRGGHLGGQLSPQTPLPHYFSDDTARDLALLRAIITTHRPDRLHLGHGGPVPAHDVRVLADRAVANGGRSGPASDSPAGFSSGS
jgi:glyoxylase-like metal-dependent hydrolase (beta-lactamase superfamily II)